MVNKEHDAMSRKVRLLLMIFSGLAVFVILVLLGLYLAARKEPAFYREALKIKSGVLEQASDRMLQQSTALASAVRKEGRWEALFTAEQINGWLAVDMVKNHPRAMPPSFHDPRVAMDAKNIMIACRFEKDGVNSVLSLTIEPYVLEPNVVALRIVSARAGLLPAPLGPVLDRITQAARDMRFHLAWRHSGGDPVALLSLPPSDDRPVRIETLRLGEGEIYVAGTTQAAKP
jgi:hypothetical protein